MVSHRYPCAGSGTVVGNKAVLHNCIIGRGCKVGPRVVLTGVHIWNDVVIEEACHITKALLCDGVVIKKVSDRR